MVILVVALAAVDSARAQPSGKTRPEQPRKQTPPSRKSPALALGLGLGFTAVGSLALAADLSNGNDGPQVGLPGLLLMYMGPSVGRWYGGGSAAVGLLTRAAGGAFIVAAAAEDINNHVDDCFPDPSEGEDCDEADAAKADHDRKVKRLLYTGAAIWIASSLYDFVMAPLDAREHNRAHGIAVAPILMGDGAGLALGGSF